MKLAIIASLLLAGCATAKPPVLIPVPTPCVKGDLPDEPEMVRGRLTGDSGRDIGIIAGSAIELRAWGRALRGLLDACR
jgi:hypothetical protein